MEEMIRKGIKTKLANCESCGRPIHVDVRSKRKQCFRCYKRNHIKQTLRGKEVSS